MPPCPRCQAEQPDAARFCARCGADTIAATPDLQARRRVFAAHPGEPLYSVNVVTSLMPLAAGSTPQTYRTALLVTIGIPVLAAVLGFVPFALAAAAVAVPLVYLLYLYDVNEWEDQPIPVVGACVALAGVLAFGFTLLWQQLIDGPLSLRAISDDTGIDFGTVVVVALLVPIVGEVFKQIGPLWLASKPRFDDLIDGLTFGVASGATFAAVETLVLNRGLLFDGPARLGSPDTAVWVSLVITAGLAKPIVYGAATGIAVAGWSGLGEGHDGFGPGYARGLAEAIAANIAFQLGLYLTGRIDGTAGVLLGTMWGLVVAAALVVRLRLLLHTALLEGALSAAAAGSVPRWAARDEAYCGECELPLLHEACFCIACGTSVRAASKLSRQFNEEVTS